VADLIPPKEPSNLDLLAEYLAGPYIERRTELRRLLDAGRGFRDKTAVVELGYFALIFRTELDPWLALSGEILDRERGNQLGVSHKTETDKRRPVDIVKSEAAIFIAPIKRAQEELRAMQDLLSKTISWCQSQQKTVFAEEYGDLFAANNSLPDLSFNDSPSSAVSLKKIS